VLLIELRGEMRICETVYYRLGPMELEMHSHPPYKILILCHSNSARSIFAEYIFRRTAGDRFQVYSAGSHPAAQVW